MNCPKCGAELERLAALPNTRSSPLVEPENLTVTQDQENDDCNDSGFDAFCQEENEL